MTWYKVYNVKETGLNVVQHKLQKVVPFKDKKQVATNLTSAERRSLTTTITCMNATGNYISLLFIFSHKNMKAERMVGAAPGFDIFLVGHRLIAYFLNLFDSFIKCSKLQNSSPPFWF